MRLSHTLPILLALLFLSACTTTAKSPQSAGSNLENQPTAKPLPEIIVIEKEVAPNSSAGIDFSPYAHAKTAELLRYIDDFSQATDEWQKTELDTITNAIDQDPENWRLQIKHAAVLALPNSAVHNYREAKKLLTGLLTNDELNPSDQHLVQLIATFNTYQQQQSVKVLDAAKKQQMLTKKNKALQQKLNDIKNIEKTMIERNAKSSAK